MISGSKLNYNLSDSDSDNDKHRLTGSGDKKAFTHFKKASHMSSEKKSRVSPLRTSIKKIDDEYDLMRSSKEKGLEK